jgi:hypothetical protein
LRNNVVVADVLLSMRIIRLVLAPSAVVIGSFNIVFEVTHGLAQITACKPTSQSESEISTSRIPDDSIGTHD